MGDLNNFEYSSSDNESHYSFMSDEDNNLENSSTDNDYSFSSDHDSSFDSDDSTTEFFHIKNGNEPIYTGSNIKLSEFVVCFFALCFRIGINDKGIGFLLLFINAILPKAGIIVPKSLYKLLSLINFTKNKKKRQYVCLACNKLLNNEKETCNNQTCKDFKKQKINIPKHEPYFVTHDYVSHLRLIIEKHWHKIIEYRQTLDTVQDITDINNAQAFNQSKQNEISHNSISLILFVDEADFSKSTSKNKLYFILGQVLDLPYTLRNSFSNILTLLTWGGYIYNFAKVMRDFIKPNFPEFLQTNLYIEKLNLNLKINLFVVIADAPCSAKIYNIHQFNGEYGCLKCMHQGQTYGRSTRIYIYDINNHEPRTRQLYLNQVEEAKSSNRVRQGVKGEAFFTKYVNLPLAGLIDYMHCCLEGTFKRTIEILFSPSNFRQNFYLGNRLNDIGNLLSKIQYPSDYNRLQRHIKDFGKFKANELRTFLINASIYVFRIYLPPIYYNHFIKYVLFIRLLTQPSISKNDITFASVLINKFVSSYHELYGEINMTYNLHCHLHLPLQVLLYGPLHMVSCFPFEGFFKICHGLYHGTRAITEQIIKNLNLMQFLSHYKFFNKFQIKENQELRHMFSKLELNTNNLANKPNGLVNAVVKAYNSLTSLEQNFLQQINFMAEKNFVKESYVLIRGAIGKFNFINHNN
jgi:hypothetical protein